MHYTTRLAEIREAQQRKASQDALAQDMAHWGLPLRWAEVPTRPAAELFQQLDGSRFPVLREADSERIAVWSKILLDLVHSLTPDSFSFIWRQALPAYPSGWLEGHSGILSLWLQTYPFFERDGDVVIYHPATDHIIAMLVEEHEVQFKQVKLTDFA